MDGLSSFPHFMSSGAAVARINLSSRFLFKNKCRNFAKNLYSLLRKTLIYCLLILLISNGKVMELIKIPALLEHYDQHKTQRNELSFGEFLFMHYVGDDANNRDNSSDAELPFKGTSQIAGVNLDLYLTPVSIFNWDFTPETTIEKPNPVFIETYAGNYNSQLFRPPVFV